MSRLRCEHENNGCVEIGSGLVGDMDVSTNLHLSAVQHSNNVSRNDNE